MKFFNLNLVTNNNEMSKDINNVFIPLYIKVLKFLNKSNVDDICLYLKNGKFKNKEKVLKEKIVQFQIEGDKYQIILIDSVKDFLEENNLYFSNENGNFYLQYKSEHKKLFFNNIS